ncbi:MAG: hypothetical protein LBL93_07340 [Ruminococcus sp.]|nr:hypothetical protein [Ruminococcus sp.]
MAKNIIIKKQDSPFLRFLSRYGPTIAVLIFCFLSKTVFGRDYNGTVEAHVGYLVFGIITFVYEVVLIALGPREINGVKMPIPLTHFFGVMLLLTYMAIGVVPYLIFAAMFFLKDLWSEYFYTKVKFEINDESLIISMPFGMKREIFFKDISSLDYSKGFFALTFTPLIKIKYGGNLLDVSFGVPNAYIGDKWLSDIINDGLLKYGNSGIKIYDDYVNEFGYKYYETTEEGLYYMDLPKKKVFLPWNKITRLDYGQSWHPSTTKNYIMVHGRTELLEDVYFEFDEEQMVVGTNYDGSRSYHSLAEEIKTHCIIYPKIDVTTSFSEKYGYTAVWDFVDNKPMLGYDTVEGLLPDKFNLQ